MREQAHFFAFFEIYKINQLNFQNFADFRVILHNSFKFSGFPQNFADFSANLSFFAANFTEFCRNCGKQQIITEVFFFSLEIAEIYRKIFKNSARKMRSRKMRNWLLVHVLRDELGKTLKCLKRTANCSLAVAQILEPLEGWPVRKKHRICKQHAKHRIFRLPVPKDHGIKKKNL